MGKFIEVDKRAIATSNEQKFKQFLRRTFRGELFVGLWVVFREMIKKNNTHTIMYPKEKMYFDNRYRGVHRLLRLLESGNERCIGCGLCEKICVSNCIAMETRVDENGRKKVQNYSINLGRCVYCGLCADVCPEIAIVHGKEFELASEQRAYFAQKDDMLTKINALNSQVEFEGYGSLPANADNLVKPTPVGMAIAKDEKGKDNV